MASARNPLNDFILTPQQQGLLFAALNSNKQPTDSPVNGAANMSPTSFTNSPVLNNGPNGLQQESPFLDYDYDFSNGDTSYDFSYADSSQAKMVGDLPDSNSSDSAKAVSENNDNEKRAHPDDENDEEEGAAKRQETGEKAPKKPGRKPLTTEPTSVSLIPYPLAPPPPTWDNAVLTVPTCEETESTEQGRSARIPRAEGEAPQGSGGQGRRVGEDLPVSQSGELSTPRPGREDDHRVDPVQEAPLCHDQQPRFQQRRRATCLR